MKNQPLDRGGDAPFPAYRLLSLTFGAGLSTVAWSRAAKRVFATPLGLTDLALVATATHKLAQIIATERVTMGLRAPFTHQRDEGRDGVRKEIPVEHGLHRALGELLTCPYCLAPWIAALLVAGYVFAPVPTRVVTTVFTVTALSDLLTELHKKVAVEKPKPQSEPLVQQVVGVVS